MNFVRSLFQFLRRLEGLAIAMVLLVLYIVLIIAAPTVFTRPLIYISFLETVPPTLMAALGLTLVITAGEIDLSFPAVVSLSGFALSLAWKTFDPSYGAWIGLGLALDAGPFVGWFFYGLPNQSFWALALAILLWFSLNRHKFGESVIFVGDNANVARVM